MSEHEAWGRGEEVQGPGAAPSEGAGPSGVPVDPAGAAPGDGPYWPQAHSRYPAPPAGPGGYGAPPPPGPYAHPADAYGAAPGGPYDYGAGAPPAAGSYRDQRSSGPGARALRSAAAVLVVVAAAVTGAGVSRAVWPGSSGTGASAASPGTTVPAGGGSSSGQGGGLSPFFGNGGSAATTTPSEGAGAPSDVSSIASRVAPAVVDINSTFNYQGESGAGTGIVLTSNGLVLTNNHVIAESTKLTATDVGNGRTYNVTVLGYDNTHDVALVQLQGASGLATAKLATVAASTGQAVVAVGNAGGTGGAPTSAGGSVTALGQSITASDALTGGSEHLSGLIEVNANIQSGDSGGPLVNTAGEVIGMDTAASDSFSFSSQGNQGFAIPVSQAMGIARTILSGKGSATVHVGQTAFLGVLLGGSASTSPFGGGGLGSGGFGSGGLGNGFAGTTTVPVPGIAVSQVVGGSPAQSAGVTAGSTLTRFDGATLTSESQLTHLMVPYHPGDKVAIGWTDATGASRTATVTLASGPPS